MDRADDEKGPVKDNPENVWQVLKRQTLYTHHSFKFTADSDNPSVATLRGNIVIELNYNGQSWGRARPAS